MAVVSIVLISHSKKLGEGLKELLDQLTARSVHVVSASGIGEELGTNALDVKAAIESCPPTTDVAVLFDLGSARLSCETALELMEEQVKARVKVVDAPLVEGAVVAAVEASLGSPIDVVAESAVSARTMRKWSPERED
jgi:phosphoenolpyruvate---glycerone phosphotransferase subunit DhaM